MTDRLRQIKDYIIPLLDQGICIAFSGGVDSSILLKIASDEAKTHNASITAVTFQTKLHPKEDIEICKNLAKQLNVKFYQIPIDEFSDHRIQFNPVNRCYLCKSLLFQTLKDFATSKNLSVIMDGSNYDDLNQYRPGMAALSELSIKSPLLELEITKQEIREIAHILGLKVAQKPSAPCLATRIPYGTKLDYSLLAQIEQGEDYLKKLGFLTVRIRIHNEITRIELLTEQFDLFLLQKSIITKKLKELGFQYITLDLEGFRSGSMDEYLDFKFR